MAANRLQTRPQGTYQYWLALLTFLILPLVLAVLVNTGQFRGLQSQDAIEQAVTARNLVNGRGYTTYVVRPRALALVKNKTLDRQSELIQAPLSVLPAALALKIPHGDDPFGKAIALASMVAFVAVVYLVAALGGALFGPGVGRFAALLTCLSPALLTNLAISGDGRAWASVWLLLLWYVLMRVPHGTKRNLWCGVLMGLCMLTSYGLVLPLLLGVLPALLLLKPTAAEPAAAPADHEPGEEEPARVEPVRRSADWRGAGITLGVVVILAMPWMIRNVSVTGMPLPGLGTYDVMRNTDAVPGRSIERSYVGPGTSWLGFISKATRATFKKCAAGLLGLRAGLPTSGEWVLLGLMLGALLMPLPPEVRLGAGALAWCILWDGFLTAATSQNYTHLVLWMPLVALFGGYALLTALDRLVTAPARKWFVTWQPAALRKWIQAGVLFLLFTPGIYPQMFTPDWPAQHPSAANHKFLKEQAAAGTAILTDDPWTVAWQVDRPAVWLPQTEEDLTEVLKLGSVWGVYFTRRATQMFGWASVGENDQIIQEAGNWWQWAATMPVGYLDFQRLPSRTDGEVLLIYQKPADAPAETPSGESQQGN